jgi:hypothetical protein
MLVEVVEVLDHLLLELVDQELLEGLVVEVMVVEDLMEVLMDRLGQLTLAVVEEVVIMEVSLLQMVQQVVQV